ncbi:hypothetical protein PNP85_12595 [Halobacterium salinarum]|uniref:hypothetical protein n=1 Tax=Halobacterium salinarum TaxID=2242 RepID=UPI002553BA45|nr:hypothetical protein [Halobacterium salinarum]MDL0140342.1 hypothetical protein [Halobacterium salinarum]
MSNHRYDIEVADDEIADLLSSKRKPWWDDKVLNHLHNELNMSLSAIGDMFGISRQAVYEAATKLGVETERKSGNSSSKTVAENQTVLSDYQDTGLEQFI